ncbi:thiosulfate sulfurtransferase [Brachionus plicatilis]|uniref:Thiosulfate sulfurtransferase n=1 Tax=Brachionus plicatilis TaxID=10195 RepID=A0A3M7QH75_BRAPC|nr:thiosulfate sulfurtransferase [Brachionus plicatilis]
MKLTFVYTLLFVKLAWLSADNTKWITSNEFYQLVAQFKSSSSHVIIDTRSSNEYNGWKSFDALFSTGFDFNQTGLATLYDLKSGHVTNSLNLDADWIHLFESELKHTIETRLGLSADGQKKSIIVYDRNKERVEKVQQYLNANFNLDLVYLCKLTDDELSRFVLTSNVTGNLFFQEPFYDQLLSPEALYAILRPFNDSYVVNTKPVTDYFLFEVGPENTYEQSHIPTAVHFKIEDLMSGGTRKPKQQLAKALLSYGILPYNVEMVILYGNPDPMPAYRVAIIMKSMGVKEVRVLNGGFRTWLIKNYPLETYRTKGYSVKNRIPENLKLYEEQSQLALTPINYMVDESYVADLVKNRHVFNEQYQLVDIRTYEEFAGEQTGYAGVKYKGRIPGSFWGKAGTGPNELEEYRNLDYTMRSGADILRMWDELGIDYKKKNLIFYCGNGMRSAEVMFYAEVIGMYKISMYDGGWMDWSANKKNVFQLGAQEDDDVDVFENYKTTAASTTLSLTTLPSEVLAPNNKINSTSGTTQKSTQNSVDIFYKNQFDSVTADPSHASQLKFSHFALIFISLVILF